LREASAVLRYLWPAIGLLTACPPAPTSPAMRPRDPTCAVRDCATGKIIDNGCTADGRCETCVNFCKNGVPSARDGG